MSLGSPNARRNLPQQGLTQPHTTDTNPGNFFVKQAQAHSEGTFSTTYKEINKRLTPTGKLVESRRAKGCNFRFSLKVFDSTHKHPGALVTISGQTAECFPHPFCTPITTAMKPSVCL